MPSSIFGSNNPAWCYSTNEMFDIQISKELSQLSTWDAEAGGLEFEVSLGYIDS